MSKTLVAYFSASGVTAKLAKNLAEAAGADIYEIRPEEPYTNADLNWQNKNSRSSVEMKDKSFRPSIADTDANIADYDTIAVWAILLRSFIPVFRTVLLSRTASVSAQMLL